MFEHSRPRRHNGRVMSPVSRPDPEGLLAVLNRCSGTEVTSLTCRVTHVEQLSPRTEKCADWPCWVPAELRDTLAGLGIGLPWTHQAEAADLAHSGRDVVIATGTASGKSLGYLLPVLAALLADPRACALYLAPTKALAADQLGSVQAFGLSGIRASCYDGDAAVADRDWARAHANWILTNPDMLHRGVLAAHHRWARVLRRLKYVVVDECHAYRGVFGSHVGLVLRRLIRMARRYGSDPVVVLASATSTDPARSAQRLVGRTFVAVTDDGSPRPGADFVLWEPGFVAGGPGSPAPPVGTVGGRPDDGRAGGVRRAHADLRAVPPRSRTDRDERPPPAGRHCPGAGRNGGRLPRRLPAGGSPGAGTRPWLWGADGRCLHQRTRTRGRHCRAGRSGAGRLPGHSGVDVAAGRARGSSRGRRTTRAGGVRGQGRPAGFLSRAPSRGGVRAPGGDGRHRSDEPVHSRSAPGLRGGRTAPDVGRPRAVRRPRGGRTGRRRAGRPRGAAAAPVGLLLRRTGASCGRCRLARRRWRPGRHRRGGDRPIARHRGRSARAGGRARGCRSPAPRRQLRRAVPRPGVGPRHGARRPAGVVDDRSVGFDRFHDVGARRTQLWTWRPGRARPGRGDRTGGRVPAPAAGRRTDRRHRPGHAAADAAHPGRLVHDLPGHPDGSRVVRSRGTRVAARGRACRDRTAALVRRV